MIISKEAEVIWSHQSKNYYIEKGYKFTQKGDIFLVKIEDLPIRSKARVQAKCVSCNECRDTSYSSIRKSLDDSILKEYYCKKCIPERVLAEHKFKQENGLLKRGDNGYWKFEENVNKEVLKYIETYGEVDKIVQRDYALHQAVVMDGRHIDKIVKDIGLKWSEVSSYVSNHYFKDFDKVEKAINEFISIHNRFPSSKEMSSELKIQPSDIKHHGTVDGIKDKMNYVRESDLIDDNGFRNKSIMEFKVAQYMIANNLYHKRDVLPFENRKISCDFFVETKNGEEFYIEVWGYGKSSTDPTSIRYNEKRKMKEGLYKSNNLNLISIEFDEIYNLNHQELQLFLKNKFANISDKELLIFKETSFLHPKRLSDKEILDAIMIYSNVAGYLPKQDDVIKNKKHSYLHEIRLRHGSYFNFAESVGMKLQNLKAIYEGR